MNLNEFNQGLTMRKQPFFLSSPPATNVFWVLSSSNNKKTPKVENEHPLLKTTWYVNCVCAFVNGLLLIKIDCEKIGENRGSKDTSYSPFYGTVGRHPGNMWIVSIRLVNQNCIPCCILLLLRSRVPFHASFQRFEGDFEGVFLFYFRWGFEENEEIDQIHW